MIVPLLKADAQTCGGKAGALGALLRAVLPVPDGFVVPFAAYRAIASHADQELPAGLLDALNRGLAALGAVAVAVRSSASGEDTGQASAAGQHARGAGHR